MAQTSSDIVIRDPSGERDPRREPAGQSSYQQAAYQNGPPVYSGGPPADDETEQIRADIEATRAEMGSTIDAIQEKLSPHHVMNEVKKSVREATIGKAKEVMHNVGEKVSEVTENVAEVTKEAGASAIRTVKENPVPFVLIGSGIGLLIVNQFRSGSNGKSGKNGKNEYPQPLGGEPEPQEPGLMDQAQSAVGAATTKVQETASDLAEKARVQANQIGAQVKETARQAEHQFRKNMRERPLVVGAIAMVIGALVALSIPTTEVEQEYLGETRDKLVDRAEEAAKDAMQKVQTKVKEATAGNQPA
jgi:ElaB/YqjD/DUF883 family membrane-anchored ribosome-binding protein